MPHTIRRSAVKALAATLAIASLVTVGGCGEAERAAAKANANEITIWTHTAGSEAELAGVQQIINDYNASPDKKAPSNYSPSRKARTTTRSSPPHPPTTCPV